MNLDLLFKEYGVTSEDELLKSKTERVQSKSFSVALPRMVKMSEDECKRACEKMGIVYQTGYENRVIKHVITSEACDRMGDIIRMAGIVLENYLKNAVIQFAHDTKMTPVGNTLELFKDASVKKMSANGLYMDERVDSSGRSDLIFRMIANGFMKACSIGFMPLEYYRPSSDEERKKLGLGQWGVEYRKTELTEWSPCPVPANPEALSASLKSIDTKILATFQKSDFDLMEKFKFFEDKNTLDLFSTVCRVNQTIFTPAFSPVPEKKDADSGQTPEAEATPVTGTKWTGHFDKTIVHAIELPHKKASHTIRNFIKGDTHGMDLSCKSPSGKTGRVKTHKIRLTNLTDHKSGAEAYEVKSLAGKTVLPTLGGLVHIAGTHLKEMAGVPADEETWKEIDPTVTDIIEEIVGTKESLIEDLNEDLSLEYSAAVQYIQHAAMICGAEFDHIRKEILDHAEEEIGHAIEISDKINFLGGAATIEVGEIKTAATASEMLTQDAEGEKLAIERYKERITAARMIGEHGVEAMLLGILSDEEEHLNDITTTLKVKADDISGTSSPEIERGFSLTAELKRFSDMLNAINGTSIKSLEATIQKLDGSLSGLAIKAQDIEHEGDKNVFSAESVKLFDDAHVS